ncbi:MAG: DUF456 domain-containing protein [Actinomycetales bacterium]|nr:DUF456 domain-containing protein [Actinomycetales bacterium]
MSGGAELLVGLAILVGLFGVVVQVLPGSLLVLGAILVWAIVTGGAAAWIVLAVAVVAVVGANVWKYFLAARHLTAADVPSSTLWWGGLGGVVGFFVIPVVGLVVGFLLAVYVAEYVRRREARPAWHATVVAMKATGLTILVELGGALIATGAWIVGLLVT